MSTKAKQPAPQQQSQSSPVSPVAAAAAAAAADAANAAAAATAAASAATSAARNAAAAAAAASGAVSPSASSSVKTAPTSPPAAAGPASSTTASASATSPVSSPPAASDVNIPLPGGLSVPDAKTPASSSPRVSPRPSPHHESKGSLQAVEAWTLKMDTIHAHSVQHFRDFLRWSAENDIITDEQLTRLITSMDQFIEVRDDSQPSMSDPNSLDEDEPVVPFNDDDEVPSDSADGNALAPTRSTSGSVSSSGSGSSGLPRSWSSASDEDPAIQAIRLSNIAEAMEHPATGVKIGRRRHLLKHYHNVFVASEAVEWMIKNEHAKNVADAVELGRRLAAKGYIAHVIGHMFENDKLFFRFTKHPQSFALKVLPNATACGSWHASVLSLVYHIHENNVLDWLDTVNPEYMKIMYPAVLLWSKQNADLHTEVARRLFDMTEKAPAVRLAFMAFTHANGECVGKKFDIKPTDVEMNSVKLVESFPPSKIIKQYQDNSTHVVHPFTHDLCTVELKKEFVSSAKPAWMRLYKVDTKEQVLPDVIAKVGDDLRKDLCVQLIFRACESFWAAANETWSLGAPPRVATTQVMAVGPVNGFIEFVKGRTIKEVVEEGGWKDIDVMKLAPTIVGAMVSGFVLGVRDRHSENWMLLDEKENPKLMQIDFGYMLMENPGGLPLDTPRLTMQPELIKVLKEKQTRDGRSLMDDLRTDLITAYKVLRTHHPALVSFAKVVLSTVYAQDQVESFMWGKHCFRSGQSDAKALAWFDDKVNNQLKSVVWRRSAKHALVKAYYGVKTAMAAIPSS